MSFFCSGAELSLRDGVTSAELDLLLLRVERSKLRWRSLGCLPDVSLGGRSGHAHLGADSGVDPGHAGGIKSLCWLRRALLPPLEELVAVAGENTFWDTLL